MVPQQAYSQNRALESVRVHIACPFAICYLLFAIPVLPLINLFAIAYNVLGVDGVPGVDGVSL
jgi:hypothetical protein